MLNEQTPGDSSEHSQPAPSSRGPVGDVLKTGMSLGRYVVLERLGHGGMGVVYAAFDPQLDRKVALKLMRPDMRDGSLEDEGKFRTKSLRNVALSAPYFHAGQAATLKDVVWFYNQGGDHSGPNVSPLMVPLGLADEEQADLEAQLAETRAALDAAETRQSWANKFRVQLSGYLDVGFFDVQGNGAGVRKDLDRHFPEYGDLFASWVLVGDPLSTAINSPGDVADFGDSRAIRFDPVHSQGKPSFLVNNVNLNFAA